MLIWKYYRNTPNDKNLNEIGEAGSSFTLTNLHTIISSYLNTQIGNFKRNITTNLKNFLGVNHVRVALENNFFLSEKKINSTCYLCSEHRCKYGKRGFFNFNFQVYRTSEDQNDNNEKSQFHYVQFEKI